MVPGMSQVLSIAIAGAGIGGLTAAAFLARAGHWVVVFDQFTAPQPVGSGLVIQPVGQAVLRMIGAEAGFARGAWLHRMTGVEVVGGRKVLDVAYDRAGGPRRGLAIHRTALFEAVHAAALAAGAVIVPDTRIDRARACADGREVLAKRASLGRFDLVVDAAGAGAALSPLKARALGFGAIWGTVPWPARAEMPQDELTQRYRRADRMAGVMPLGQVFADKPAMAAVF